MFKTGSHRPGSLVPALCMALALSGVGCSRKAPEPAGQAGGSSRVVADSVLIPTPGDGLIAARVLAMQEAGLADARLALSRTKSVPVMNFAKQMVSESLAGVQEWKDLDTKIQLVPVEDEKSRQFTTLADSTRATFEPNSGLAFDRAFMAQAVAFHQNELALMDSTFIPDVHAPELKAWLLAHREMEEKHLTNARQVLDALQR